MLPTNLYRAIRHTLAPLCALSTLLIPHLANAQSVPAVCVGMNTEHTSAVVTGSLAPPLKARWSVTMPGRVSAPLIAGGRVYILTRLGASYGSGLKLVAINSASGVTEWETTVSTSEGWGAMAYSPAVSAAPSIVVQCGDGQLRTYDALNGSARWTVSTSYIADAPPVARNGRVYVSAGNALRCYLVSNGQLVWSKSVRGSSRSAPAVSANNEVYVSYSCPQVYKFNGNDGNQNWNYGGDSCSGGGGSTPSLFGGKLYVRESQYNSSGVRTGFVFDAATGTDIGTMNSHGAAAYLGNLSFNVFRGNSAGNGSIRAVALDTNTEVWNWTDGGTLTSPVVLNGRVYVGSSLGKIYALDPQTGSLLWTTTIGDAVVTDSDYSNSSPFTAIAAGEDLLMVPAQNRLVAFEAYSATDTTAPTGYVSPASLPYIPATDFIRNFPTSVSGIAYDNDGGIGVDRVEIAISRPLSPTGAREYFTNSYSWATTPRYYSTTLNGTAWVLNSTYFDSYIDSGSYWIEVRTYDRAGNMGYKAYPIWVDKTAPTTTLTSPQRYTNSFTTLQGTAVDNTNGIGVASVKVSLFREDVYNPYGDTGAYWNGTEWIASNTVTTPPLLDCSYAGNQWRCTVPLPSIDSMPEKNYLVRPVATDMAGNATNLNYTWNTFTFRVDKTPPTLVFGTPSPAPNAAGWNNTSVSIPYTASDSSGIASATPGSPLILASQGPAVKGTVTVTDAAGNSAQFVSPTRKIDMGAPLTQAALSGPQTPPSTTYTGTVMVTLSAIEHPASAPLSGVADTLYSIDGGATQTYTAPFTVSALGSHTISFWSRDVAGNVEAAKQKTFTIGVPNTAPSASSASPAAGDEDTAQSIVLSGTDPEGDTLTYTVVTQPTHGTLSGNAPNLSYTPTANYFGTDSFTFKVSDGALESAVATVSLTITAIDDVPIATVQSVTTPEDTTKDIVLTGTDIENEALTFSIGTQPTHGVLSGTAPNLTYTPDADYNGSDSFTFTVKAGGVESEAATVSISVTSVSDAPVAVADSFNATEDQTFTVAAPGVLFNDYDPDGDTLTAVLNQNANDGSVTLSSNGGFTYVPDADFNGIDSFKYHVRDGAIDSGIVTVTINVASANDAPTASAQSLSTNEDTAKAFVLDGSDVEGDTLTYSIASQPANGVLSGTAPNLTYTPNADCNGSDSFTFKMNDGTADSSAVTVSIVISAVNDAPTASAQNVATNEDSAKAITLSGADIEGDTLTFSVVTQPAHGVLSGTVPNLTYTPAADYNGSDSFTFKANDGAIDSAAATVSITVNAVNDAPVALIQGFTTPEDTAKLIVLTGTDVEGDTLTYSIVTQPSNGVLSGTAPNLTYTPNANYNGNDSFTFKVSDGTLSSETSTNSIVVNAINDAPVPTTLSLTTLEDTAKSLVLSGADVDSSSLTYSIVTPPTKGTLSGTAPNLTYTPNLNSNGSDSFVWKVSDGALSANSTAIISVTSVNDAPTADAQSVTTAQNTAKAIVLTGADVDGDALTYTIVANPTKGTLSGTGANRTYTPNAGVSGSDSFTFKTSDASLSSAVTTVNITITAAPVAGCVVTYNITNQWPGGFTADVIIKNNGPAINGWTLAWTFPGDQKATNLWNGVVTQTGKNVSVKDASWNKSIPTDGTATIGFQATFSGTNAKPTAFTVNGVASTIQ